MNKVPTILVEEPLIGHSDQSSAKSATYIVARVRSAPRLGREVHRRVPRSNKPGGDHTPHPPLLSAPALCEIRRRHRRLVTTDSQEYVKIFGRWATGSDSR